MTEAEELRSYSFTRYRQGRAALPQEMAQGIEVHALSLEAAITKAVKIAKGMGTDCIVYDGAREALSRKSEVIPAAHDIANAIEKCDWSVPSIGNKEILKAAVAYLRRESSGGEKIYTQAEFDECGKIGEQDGYGKAMQEIDMLTGGDGEYRYCMGHEDSDRHCPDAPAMKQRIIDRFNDLSAPSSGDGETAWLVERDGKWWGPTCSEWSWREAVAGCEPPLWTADANAALRFARKEDAEAFIRWKDLQPTAKATEHIWIEAPWAVQDDNGIPRDPVTGKVWPSFLAKTASSGDGERAEAIEECAKIIERYRGVTTISDGSGGLRSFTVDDIAKRVRSLSALPSEPVQKKLHQLPAAVHETLLSEARAHIASADDVIAVMPNTTRAIIEGLLGVVTAPTPVRGEEITGENDEEIHDEGRCEFCNSQKATP